MSTGIYTSVQDFDGEGTAEVLDRLQHYGLDEVVLAVAYHRARDVTPHSPTRLTVRHDGAYFRTDDALFGPGSLPSIWRPRPRRRCTRARTASTSTTTGSRPEPTSTA